MANPIVLSEEESNAIWEEIRKHCVGANPSWLTLLAAVQMLSEEIFDLQDRITALEYQRKKE